jgi:hypothetical protein
MRRSSRFAVASLRLNDHPLDAVNETFVSVAERLRGLAPAAIEDRVRGGDARGVRCIL